jgi:hypothetical protein
MSLLSVSKSVLPGEPLPDVLDGEDIEVSQGNRIDQSKRLDFI